MSSIEVIKFSGELEIGRKDEIASLLRADGAAKRILVDCSEVTYADSTALAALLRFRNEAEQHAVQTALVIGSPQFARLIAYAGLANAFAVFDDRASALSYLGTAAIP